MKKIFYLILLFLLGISCKDWFKEPDQPVFAVVICDASNSATKFSQNQEAYFDSMTSVIRALPGNMPPRSALYYIPVTWDRFKQGLGGRPLEKKPVNDAQAIQLRQSQQQLLDTICNQLHQLANTDASNSCLLTSISNAYSIIQSYKATPSYSKYHFQIIILSDMMEYCTSNAVGKIDMENTDSKTIAANLSAISDYATDINFNKTGIELKIVILTPGITAKQTQLLQSYWRKLFQKMSYDSSNLIFQPPASIKNTNN